MSKSHEDKPGKWPDWLTQEQIDTIAVAFTGVYGLLFGKRMTYDFFRDHVADAGTHACNYLMTTDLNMNVLPGFKLASWDQGFGDFHVKPDMQTIRRLPWQSGTALVLADLFHTTGEPVEESPRRVLARQLEKCRQAGMKACIGSELEFVLFAEDYQTITKKGFRDLVPSSDYLIDYHILQPGRDEDVLRRLRNEMPAAGIPIECSKGEAGQGQHEVNLVYAEAMEMADRHIVYKTGAKEIASQQGKALTFMAKWAANQAGNGFHLHTSLWDAKGENNLFWDAGAGQKSELFGQFLAGLLKYSRELSYFFAPTVNSYKRYQNNSWAPTAIVCGHDNRSCGLRVVGAGNSLRIENRMPGADANPYLTFAATLAAGIRGVEEKLDPGQIYQGNAYLDESLPRLPESLAIATELLANSEMAKLAFGAEVVEFYVQTARLENRAFRQSVTDWERQRYFEQI
ncbi:MAG: glutamine synthetase [Planctomycetes bacterium]|nr:glutamine synthetase [Planctomycetota bacterium]